MFVCLVFVSFYTGKLSEYWNNISYVITTYINDAKIMPQNHFLQKSVSRHHLSTRIRTILKPMSYKKKQVALGRRSASSPRSYVSPEENETKLPWGRGWGDGYTKRFYRSSSETTQPNPTQPNPAQPNPTTS